MLSVPVQLMGTQPTCCVCSQGFRDSILEQRNSERRHPSACFIVLCKTYCTHGSISLVGPPSKTIQGPPRPGASRPPGSPPDHGQITDKARSEKRHARSETKRATWGEDKCVVRKKLPTVRKKMPHCHPRSKSRYTVPHSHIKGCHGQKKDPWSEKSCPRSKKRRSHCILGPKFRNFAAV